MFNFLIFMVFDFIPALMVYCALIAVVLRVYQKHKFMKRWKKERDEYNANLDKEVKNNENK